MKKRINYLKGLRVLLAILFFIPILLFFVDFTGILPNGLHRLLHLQIVPAVLSGMVGLLVFQFLLALLFGRIYCSAICPAGVFQDVINRLYCIGKKKKKGRMRFSYHKPLNIFRYVLLGIAVVLALFGLTELVVWLDPYSNFGRIAANLFRPVVIWGNNIIADVLMRFDIYTLYHVTIKSVMLSGVVAGFVVLITFIIMVALRGRLFCNTLCPVGALLSLVSRYSLFRISFDPATCNSCGLCERTCKAEAIDSKAMKVDTSRCVDCFNCTSACNRDSLKYRFTSPLAPLHKRGEGSSHTPDPSQEGRGDNSQLSTFNFQLLKGRRSFLASTATIAATLPVVSALAKTAEGETTATVEEDWGPVTPPGAVSLERFKDICTGCHICVVKCPTQILKPAGLEFGFGYMLRPHVSYKTNYCNYECTICGDVCPTHAIKTLTVEEKKTTQVGIATFIIDLCIVHTEGTDCGACSEHCPTQAVHMIPYKGTLTIPHVEPDICIGCGGCESICPVNPRRAIIVKANHEHKVAELPAHEEVKDIKIDDFGF